MPGKLSDRLQEASRRLFVGREAQRDLFADLVATDDLPFNVLHIYGPGGIGKTSLLYEFQRTCREHNIPFVALDARSAEPDPITFRALAKESFGLPDSESFESHLESLGRFVLMIDTFELWASLEQWLFNVFFAELPEHAVIVLSGRFPLSTTWNNHPGWRSLIRTVSLRNLSDQECKLYLSRIGLPENSHQSVIEYTHGHPLALSLIAEGYAQRPDTSFSGELAPDFIKVLMDRFIHDAPGPVHRLALEASALVNNLTESLLAALVDEEDVRDLFEWLRNLSFMDAGPRGVYPHDLARDVMSAELRWRNPESYKLLHHRARAFYNNNLQDATPAEQSAILTDYIFLHRDNPIVQPFFMQLQATWEDRHASLSSDRYNDGDKDAIVQIVAALEGNDSAKYARHWLKRQPENIVVYRNQHGEVVGFLFLVALHETDSTDRSIDPLVDACLKHLEKEAPLRAGELATLFRFWMDSESHHQLSRVQSHIFVNMVRHYLTTPGLAFSCLPIAQPDFYQAIFNYADLHRIESLDFVENELPFGVFVHDWRVRPPAAWLDLLASREVGGRPEPDPETLVRRRIIVLSEDAFREEIRNALRAYTRPMSLKRNPLLSSRMIADRVDSDASDDERIISLVELIAESVDVLKNNPRQERAYRAVDRTYIRPAPSQEMAAELLDLPYSTFRRHLTRGVDEITAILWGKEIGT